MLVFYVVFDSVVRISLKLKYTHKTQDRILLVYFYFLFTKSCRRATQLILLRILCSCSQYRFFSSIYSAALCPVQSLCRTIV